MYLFQTIMKWLSDWFTRSDRKQTNSLKCLWRKFWSKYRASYLCMLYGRIRRLLCMWVRCIDWVGSLILRFLHKIIDAYSRNFRDEHREKKYRLWLQQAVFSVRVWSWSTLDAKNKAMVTLIVVGFLVFSDRERYLKIHTSSLSVLQSVLFMVRKLHNGNSGKILSKDITPQDFSEDERTNVDIVVIYRRLKFYDELEFNNWFAFAWS